MRSARIFGGSIVLAALIGGAAGACGSNEASSDPAGPDSGLVPIDPPASPDGGLDAGEPGGEPSLDVAASLAIDEEKEATIPITAVNLRRIDGKGLPPGARLDRAKNAIVFRPDFTQSGTYSIELTGYGGGPPATFTKTVTLALEVKDTVKPPAPVVVTTTEGAGFQRLVVRQTTDAFLDSAGYAGRTFDAVVVVPTAATAAAKAPIVISLHGFGGAPNAAAADTTAFRIEPHDPDDTYWWGYGEGLPGAIGASVPDYTLRRVLNLHAWLVATYPGADVERAFVSGGSMGGAGALTLGLLHARHFAGIDATIAQAIPKNHRPSRQAQLATLWGTAAANVGGMWDEVDLTRVVKDEAEARDQFVFTKHGKDDPTIHFGAVTFASPLTKKTFYGALEDENIGHYAVWDEGAHGPADPVMGAAWWDASWSRVTNATTFLARNKAFPAFSRSNANDDPGTGKGNGKVTFSAETGYSAVLATAGDTGWDGDIAGALNRFLRWDTKAIVETRDHLVIPLVLASGTGAVAPAEGYPTKGDQRPEAMTSITVDVTPRRTRLFAPVAGEVVSYTYGTKKGTAVAAADGSVTIPGVVVTTTATALDLVREAP